MIFSGYYRCQIEAHLRTWPLPALPGFGINSFWLEVLALKSFHPDNFCGLIPINSFLPNSSKNWAKKGLDDGGSYMTLINPVGD